MILHASGDWVTHVVGAQDLEPIHMQTLIADEGVCNEL